MSATEKVVNDLNVSKLMLCNPKMLTSEMCIKIGQAINGAIDLLKEQKAAYQGAEELLHQKTILFDDAIKRLKEQEHKDKMFHALEEDWKRLNELLKEQEELLRKLQKDKDKLCCEISEWKHKYHDTLKEQDAEVEWCERCGRVRLKSKQECR